MKADDGRSMKANESFMYDSESNEEENDNVALSSSDDGGGGGGDGVTARQPGVVSLTRRKQKYVRSYINKHQVTSRSSTRVVKVERSIARLDNAIILSFGAAVVAVDVDVAVVAADIDAALLLMFFLFMFKSLLVKDKVRQLCFNFLNFNF